MLRMLKDLVSELALKETNKTNASFFTNEVTAAQVMALSDTGSEEGTAQQSLL